MQEEQRILGGRYLIKKKLGQGGSGSVYLCHDNKLNKDWAVKKLAEPSDIERSMELELLKTISCNVFPRIVDIIKGKDNFFLIMDYIEGVTLKDKMNQQLLTESDVLPWALEIAKGIRYLHQMTPVILYMDCKPDNIILTPEGEIRLVDLGSTYVCRADRKQRISGTKFFAPKEQRTNKADDALPDARTDIYAFGMTLYYLLTGGKKEWRLNGKLRIKDINPHISWGMSHIIEKCTMENPKQRYQSMEEVIYQLRHIREIGRLKMGKERSIRMFLVLGKVLIALAALLLAYGYQIKENNAFLWGAIISLGILLLSCKCRQFTVYEIKRDIFCGSGKRILYILGVAVGLISVMYIPSYAAKQAEDDEILNNVDEEAELEVFLCDKQGRKILIKDGTSWEITEDIIIRIPTEEIDKGEGEIMISYTNEKEPEEKKYSVKCHRK